MDITATVDPGLYAVKLVATAYTGTVHWYRRSGGADTHLGDGPVLWDYRGDLNQPYEYRATDDLETKTTPAVAVASDVPVLSSTMSQIAHPVRVVDYRPVRAYGQSTVHAVLGRSDPFVTVHPMIYPEGLLRLYVADAAERRDLWALLRGGEPLLLRTTCADAVDTMTFVATEASDPFTRDRKRGPAYLELTFQQTTETPGIAPPAPDRTYSTVLGAFATYQELLDLHGDYRSVLDGPDT